MVLAPPTHWSVIHAAGDGDRAAQAQVVLHYGPAVRAFFAVRWRNSRLVHEIDDAAQEVYLDCFKEHGALARANSRLPGGFRGYLHGIMRNVAARAEKRLARQRAKSCDPEELAGVASSDEAVSIAFDRAWAEGVVREARSIQENRARCRGGASLRRVALLQLRFGEGMPVRAIAKAWDMDPVILHADYARARAEFKAILRQVVRSQHPQAEVETEFTRLIECFP